PVTAMGTPSASATGSGSGAVLAPLLVAAASRDQARSSVTRMVCHCWPKGSLAPVPRSTATVPAAAHDPSGATSKSPTVTRPGTVVVHVGSIWSVTSYPVRWVVRLLRVQLTTSVVPPTPSTAPGSAP